MRIVNFRKFNEAKEVITYLSIDEIKDIFADIFDEGYEIKFFDTENYKIGRYFFEFTKKLSLDSLDIAEDGSGYNGLEYIKNEFEIVSMFNDPKNRLTSMGYVISFEFEFNVSSTCDNKLVIVCHLHHKDSPDEEDGEPGEDFDVEEFLTPDGEAYEDDDNYDEEDEAAEAERDGYEDDDIPEF